MTGSVRNRSLARIIQAVADWLEADDYVGCPYLNTTVELSDPTHPATQVVRDYLAEIAGYLEGRAAAAGHPDAARAGRELHAMLAGAVSLGAVKRSGAYALAARDAAVQLPRNLALAGLQVPGRTSYRGRRRRTGISRSVLDR